MTDTSITYIYQKCKDDTSLLWDSHDENRSHCLNYGYVYWPNQDHGGVASDKEPAHCLPAPPTHTQSAAHNAQSRKVFTPHLDMLLYPQTPRVKGEPFAAHSGINKRQNNIPTCPTY